MAELAYIANDDAPESVRSIYDSIEQKLGMVPNIYRGMANSPDMFKRFMDFSAGLQEIKLDAKLRELAYLTASRVNGCDY